MQYRTGSRSCKPSPGCLHTYSTAIFRGAQESSLESTYPLDASLAIRPAIRRPNTIRDGDEPTGASRGSVSGTFRTIDLFTRNHPSYPEGTGDPWAFVMMVIDHGCFFFKQLGSLRSSLRPRDLVIQGIFRRILITGEAIRSLLARGLEEPAFAAYRTLLELERDLRLVIADRSDTSARRLVLFFAVKGRRDFDKATKNATTRTLSKSDSDFFRWLRTRMRSFREWIDSADYRDVAEEVNRADHWHGLTHKDAFYKAEMATEYHLEYGARSLFVHGSNVEYDFATSGSSGIGVKPLVQRDTAPALTTLGQATHSMIDIYRLIWEDHGKPQYQESFTVEPAAGERFAIGALDALATQAINILPNPRAKPVP